MSSFGRGPASPSIVQGDGRGGGRLPLEPKAWIIPIVVALGLGIVLLRLWYLQIARGQELSAIAVSRRTVTVPIPAPRGPMLDRKGAALAGVKPTLAVLVTPNDMDGDPKAIRRLAAIIGMDAKELEADIADHLYRRFLPFVVKLGITYEQAVKIEEQRAFIPGVFVRPESLRQYPLGIAGAHAIGYVGSLNEHDVERLRAAGIELPNYVGKTGAERVFDESLIGEAGRESVEVNSTGRQIRPRTSTAPVPGERHILTIDADLQKYAYEVLAGRNGAIVAIDPRNGEILCIVSSPSYDPNLFAGGISRADWQRLNEDPAKPMHNRAAASAYAPGSTFKMVTLYAGIRAGVVSPGTTFVCRGSYRVGNRSFRCLGTHGRIDYQTAIEKSCNVFFAEIGGRVERSRLSAAAAEFGFGARVGADLLGESRGSVPTDEWIAEKELRWYPGDTTNMAVGQGYISATPLQMANYAAIIANRGRGYRPHLLRAKQPPYLDTEPQLVQPELAWEPGIDAAWWDRISRAMFRVVESGTGRGARVGGVTVGGKTGSAEHRRGSKPHAWFVGFAPVEEPRIAFAVMVEESGQGGAVAAPLAKRIVERYLRVASPSPFQAEGRGGGSASP